MKDETTWLLVSDGSRARIFELKDRSGPNGWILLRTFEHPQTRAHAGDVIMDKPGRTQQSVAGTYGHTFAQRTSLHDIERDRFARELMDLIEAACRKGAFMRLALIAPPRLLGTLLAGFSPIVRARITTSLARDYTHLDADEIGENFDRHVRAAGA